MELSIKQSDATKRRKKRNVAGFKLFLMALPFLIITFIFSYLPLYGWLYAFYDFRPGIPLSASKFVGTQWFTSIISNATQAQEVLRIMRNTLAMSSLGILTSVLPVIFAIFLVEIKQGWIKKAVQTLTTLPHFISWVLVYSVAFTLFSTDNGLVNHLLTNLGLIHSNINFLASDEHTWLTMILWSVWKGLGWGAIMYLAAIAGIDQELYEAARVDGAGRFQTIWNITVPGVLSTFFVLLLLSIANFINNGMEQYYVFQNAVNKDHIEVLDLFVYNIGMIGTSFSFATAVSMMKSVVSVFLLFIANGLSKALRGESII